MNLASFGRRIRGLSANVVAVASAITLTCGLWTHAASADNRVGEFVTSAEAWTYAPVITRLPDGAGGNVITVDNVLAVAKPGYASGDNLIAVWYVRETTGGTTWVAKTWDDTTWPGIAQRLKDDLGLTDEELAIFGQGPTGSASASAPQNYSGGFVEGDPMEAIVNDTDPNTRELLVEILKDTGYKIADPVFDEKDECGRDAKLNAYAAHTKAAMLVTSESIGASVADTISMGILANACEMKPFGHPNEWIVPLLPTFVPKPDVRPTYYWSVGHCVTNPDGSTCRDWNASVKGRIRTLRFRLELINGNLILQACYADCNTEWRSTWRCCSPLQSCTTSTPPCDGDELEYVGNGDQPRRLDRCPFPVDNCTSIQMPLPR